MMRQLDESESFIASYQPDVMENGAVLAEDSH